MNAENPAEPMVRVTLPASHWSQIVSDMENMCGASAGEIQVLADAEVEELTS